MKDEKDIAKAIVGLLDESTSRLDKNIADGLSAARARAVTAHAKRLQGAAGGNDEAGFIRSFLHYLYKHIGTSSAVLACSAVLIAFMVTQQFNNKEVEGQGDAFLLASELPPEAFADKEFHAWLEQSSQP
jgi:hypothetical protein